MIWASMLKIPALFSITFLETKVIPYIPFCIIGLSTSQNSSYLEFFPLLSSQPSDYRFGLNLRILENIRQAILSFNSWMNQEPVINLNRTLHKLLVILLITRETHV